MEFLRLAIALTGALGKLHAAGLIHKNIKPANILVEAATGNVWLTGFGIACRLRRERQAPERQTAAGVEADFRRCLGEIVSLSRIDPFTLGAHDVSDRLLTGEAVRP